MRSNQPFVGLPETEASDRCSFSPDIDQPRCTSAAVLHFAVESSWGEAGIVSLATCERHAALARAAGVLRAEHPFGPECVSLDGCWVVGPDTRPSLSSVGDS